MKAPLWSRFRTISLVAGTTTALFVLAQDAHGGIPVTWWGICGSAAGVAIVLVASWCAELLYGPIAAAPPK